MATPVTGERPGSGRAAGAGLNGTGGSRRRNNGSRPMWPGVAFIVEALLMLLFLTACLAVFMRVLGDSQVTGTQSLQLETAIVLAQDAAEDFSADPAANQGVSMQEQDGYVVTTVNTPQEMEAGTLYRAVIVVNLNDQEIYRMGTASYVSANGSGATGEGATLGVTGSLARSNGDSTNPAAGSGTDLTGLDDETSMELTDSVIIDDGEVM